MSTEIIMPQLGQAMMTGKISVWHVPDGGVVKEGELLLTVESDKSAFEIEASASGRVTHLIAANEEADVGTVLGRVGQVTEVVEAGAISTWLPASPLPASPTAEKPILPAGATPRMEKDTQRRPLASPRAKALAAGKIDLADIVPQRTDGMITAQDVDRALEALDTPSGGRRAIGNSHAVAIRRLQASWTKAPHIVQMIEIDATRLVEAQRLARDGCLPATLNDIIVQAAADTMAEFPDLNAFIDGDEIVTARDIDVSLAVATERGLRTPVIRSVAGLPLAEVARKSAAAIEDARLGRAAGARASLTISNLGKYGVRWGTPVLNLDEAVLIFVGNIVERAQIVDGLAVARSEMVLSLAFDHRVVDGLRAAEFSSALGRRLEAVDVSGYKPAADEPSPERPARRTVTLDLGAGYRCDLRARHQSWQIDEPVSVRGTDTGPDPVTAMIGALLACLSIAFKFTAQRRNIVIEQVSGHARANPEGKVREIRLELCVWTDESPEKVRDLLKRAKSACHVHDMLRPDLDVEVSLDIRRPGEA